MQDLQSLAIIWIAVFIAHALAAKTRLTPVLWFLAMGCLLVNIGILPEDPGVFLIDLSQVGILVIIFALHILVPITIRMWKPRMLAAEQARLKEPLARH